MDQWIFFRTSNCFLLLDLPLFLLAILYLSTMILGLSIVVEHTTGLWFLKLLHASLLVKLRLISLLIFFLLTLSFLLFITFVSFWTSPLLILVLLLILISLIFVAL